MGLRRKRKGLSIVVNVAALIFTFLQPSSSQVLPGVPAPAPAPAEDLCNGIFLSYQFLDGMRLPPNDSSNQPYRFESMLTVLNNGREELKAWKVFVGFRHHEILVSATNVVIANGTELPAPVGNGTILAGFPETDLKTAIETAGDSKQMQAEVRMVGTQFDVAPPKIPLPSNITLVNDGWLCPKPTLEGKRELQTCCLKDPDFKPNVTVVDEEFLPREQGDLTIMYDVIRAYEQSYLAMVTMENHNPLGRLDHWKLSFRWMRDEFIFKMQGAYPQLVDATNCIYGPQAKEYQNLDFGDVLSCDRTPVIVDLPREKYNDTTYGRIPYCCRNGTILPRSMDSTQSISAFQMQVFKMPPDLNSSALFPPQNWNIKGTLNPDYQCGPPIRVSPSHYPDPSGIPSNRSAIASWQVVCNITEPKASRPSCCVSYSAFFNDSVIPCNTCACRCPKNTARTCSATAEGLLLPPDALLVPFENRTALTLAWAGIKHRRVPNPMPCGDNCGVSVNWHLATDFRGGWTARITIFNWEEISFADWFLAVELGKATRGFEKAYSFNGTFLTEANDTIFLQGLPGLNYLVAEADGPDPKKVPRVPGKQQSVLSFTKKVTPGVNVALRDGFPTKVIFNGEECSLPKIYPINGSHVRGPTTILTTVLVSVALFILLRR